MQKSKRTLLAPFGVGTVDQALLGVLQTNHFFVRLVGLSHKVVVFDEVHAYDAYMNTLFEHLLHWLRAIGTSVIILSATLPAATRSRLVKAYTGKELPAGTSGRSPYPALTIVAANELPRTLPLTPPEDIAIGLHWLTSRDSQAIMDFLDKELAEGGCAAIICNTVKRAQDVYLALKGLDIPVDDLILFHARYPAAWRKEREDRVLRKFGKPDKDGEDYRPRKAIVVATQVIEQSLDLDFDVMISDLAPIDLLIQRAGRLHRHSIRDQSRHNLPRRLVITRPDIGDDGLPSFGDDALIYEPYVLLQTYRLLREKGEITLPSQTVELIEFVYGGRSDAGDPQWARALKGTFDELIQNARKAHYKARNQLVGVVSDSQLILQTNRGLEEDDPAVHQSFRAKTRDIASSISLICLHQTAEGLLLEPDNSNTLCDLATIPNPEQTREFLHHTLTMQNWVLVNHFAEQLVPSGWRKNAVLRHTRPVIFQDGVYVFTYDDHTYTLRLTTDLGLQMTKEA